MWSLGCIFAEIIQNFQKKSEPIDENSNILFKGGSCFPMSPSTVNEENTNSGKKKDKGEILIKKNNGWIEKRMLHYFK